MVAGAGDDASPRPNFDKSAARQRTEREMTKSCESTARKISEQRYFDLLRVIARRIHTCSVCS